jgi:hypothetical protein
MIELFSIFSSIFIFFIIFNYPFNIYSYQKIFIKNKFNIYDLILVNIIFHLNIFLILSFFNLNLRSIFYFDIFFGILFILYNYKDYLLYFKKNYINLLFFLIITYSIFIGIAYNPILSWDGLHWIFKAQTYYQGGAYNDLINIPLNYYPHLGSYIWAYFWKNSILNLEYFGRLFIAFFFVVSIFSLTEALNKFFSIFEKILVTLLITYLTTDFFLFGGYQEYFIFVYFYFFSRLFFTKNFLISDSKILNSILILLIIFPILWTKQEGFVYYIILNLVVFFYYDIKLFNKLLHLFFATILLIIFFSLKIKFFGVVTFNENPIDILSQFKLNTLDFIKFIKIFLLVLEYTIISIIKYPIWIIILISSAILLRSNYFKKKFFILFFLFFTFCFIFLIYFTTSWDVLWLIKSTLSRAMFQLSGFFIFLIIESLNFLKRNKI